MTKIKVFSCFTVKIYKKKKNPKNFKPGCARPTRGSWIRLCSVVSHVIDYHTLTLLSQFDITDIFLCPLSLKSLVSGTDIVLSLYSPDNHDIPMLFTLFGNVSNTDILILCLIFNILYIYRQMFITSDIHYLFFYPDIL